MPKKDKSSLVFWGRSHVKSPQSSGDPPAILPHTQYGPGGWSLIGHQNYISQGSSWSSLPDTNKDTFVASVNKRLATSIIVYNVNGKATMWHTPSFFLFSFSFMIPSSYSVRGHYQIKFERKKLWWFYAIWSPQGWVSGWAGLLSELGRGNKHDTCWVFFFLLILNRYLMGTWRVYTRGGKEIKKKLWPRLIFNPG